MHCVSASSRPESAEGSVQNMRLVRPDANAAPTLGLSPRAMPTRAPIELSGDGTYPALSPTKMAVQKQEPLRVSDYMTLCPVTVETGMLLVDALDRMYSDNIRHLPVVDGGGKLVGMLSTRDIAAIAAMRSLDPEHATVESAMSTVPFTCADHTPLLAVIERMEARRLGSVVVTRNDKPAGIFTTTDALRVLRGELLGKPVEPLNAAEVAEGEGSHKPHGRARTHATGVTPRAGMLSWLLLADH
jgi:CBS domain-containing protein